MPLQQLCTHALLRAECTYRCMIILHVLPQDLVCVLKHVSRICRCSALLASTTSWLCAQAWWANQQCATVTCAGTHISASHARAAIREWPHTAEQQSPQCAQLKRACCAFCRHRTQWQLQQQQLQRMQGQQGQQQHKQAQVLRMRMRVSPRRLQRGQMTLCSQKNN